MYIIKDGKKVETSGIYAIKDKVKRTITNVYAVIAGSAVRVWTIATDIISGVFSQGFWKNSEGWNNDDAWKNNE